MATETPAPTPKTTEELLAEWDARDKANEQTFLQLVKAARADAKAKAPVLPAGAKTLDEALAELT